MSSWEVRMATRGQFSVDISSTCTAREHLVHARMAVTFTVLVTLSPDRKQLLTVNGQVSQIR